jgi:hypothetical protein
MRIKVNDVDRDAILESLYAERRVLTRARRLGQLSKSDGEYLADLEQYIADIQKPVARVRQRADVWARLDALVATVVTIEAKARADHRLSQ